MIILAIETSCDDTCVAILKVNHQIKCKGSKCKGSKMKNFAFLSNVVSSQIKIHQKYGGIHPSLAKREHQRNLTITLKKALQEAGLEISNSQSPIFKSHHKSQKKAGILQSAQVLNSKFQTLKNILEREPELFETLIKFFKKEQKPKIDAIAVTVGPGLEPCLWTGVNFAKALAYFWNLPIIPINHIEAHILANWLSPIHSNSQFSILNSQINFPAICLVVSGGHTQLILMKNFGKYKILGETRDDAAGECFDKTARILGLGYPGGPAIAIEAAKFFSPHLRCAKSLVARSQISRSQTILNSQFSTKLPRPMIASKDYDFSFSGLKTAVLYNYKNQSEKIKKSKKYIQQMCYEIQQSIIDVLIKKTMRAAGEYKAKTIILGGGVVTNENLREQFSRKLSTANHQLNLLVPSKKFCTDNAAMIAITACFLPLKRKTKNWKKINADANLRLAI